MPMVRVVTLPSFLRNQQVHRTISVSLWLVAEVGINFVGD